MSRTLGVVKADGTVEEYLHTKVLGTLHRAFERAGQPDMLMAQGLADVVTYYLHQDRTRREVASSEILAIIKVVLSTTGHEAAAAALSEHHHERSLHRDRVQVVPADLRDWTDVECLCEQADWMPTDRWDKSRIVADLTRDGRVCRQAARNIASLVEEKVFGLGMPLVPLSLVRQLVLSEAAAVLRAQRELQVAGDQ